MTDRQFDTTHSPVCWSWGPEHYECAIGQIRRDEALLRQALKAKQKLRPVSEHASNMETVRNRRRTRT